MNGGHLCRQHGLELIFRFGAFDDGQQEIDCTLVGPLILRTRITQLSEKAIHKITVHRPERLRQERVTDESVRMIQGDRCRLFVM